MTDPDPDTIEDWNEWCRVMEKLYPGEGGHLVPQRFVLESNDPEPEPEPLISETTLAALELLRRWEGTDGPGP